MEIVEKESVVTPVIIAAECPNCNSELRKSNVVLATYPPEYQYYCEACGFTATSRINYPYVYYVDKKGNKI